MLLTTFFLTFLLLVISDLILKYIFDIFIKSVKKDILKILLIDSISDLIIKYQYNPKYFLEGPYSLTEHYSSIYNKDIIL